MQKTEVSPWVTSPNAGWVGVSWVPWLPLIGCDKVTRTNEKKEEKILAYRKRRAGEWLLGSVGRVALGSVLPQLAANGESAGQRQGIPSLPRGTLPAPTKGTALRCGRADTKQSSSSSEVWLETSVPRG